MSGNGQYILAGLAGGNNYRISTDYGHSFSQTVYSTWQIYGFAMNAMGDKMYLNNFYLIQLSTDYGTTWKTLFNHDYSLYAPILCDISGEYLYVALSSSMQMYSNNSGELDDFSFVYLS